MWSLLIIFFSQIYWFIAFLSNYRVAIFFREINFPGEIRQSRNLMGLFEQEKQS
jgi:hypothetical protein